MKIFLKSYDILEIEVLEIGIPAQGPQAAEIPKTDIADRQTEEIKEGSVQV